MQSAFVVGALRGGSGKTVVSVGLAASMVSRGLRVAPFKKGPDYIDAGWLTVAAGRPCYNLDLFLMTPDDVIGSFRLRSANADVALVEGNRGLFDGLDHDGTCSTAELARLLDLPVVLVVDVTKTTRTSAALVLGCIKLDERIKIVGVIANNVATARQEKIVRSSIEKECSIPLIGAIPRQRKNPFPERHLGLVPAVEHGSIEEAVGAMGSLIERYVDLASLLDCTSSDNTVWKRDNGKADPPAFDDGRPEDSEKRVNIGILQDRVFQFYYPENLEALEFAGARLVRITSSDSDLPDNIDGLYIGGGFPETHLEILADNSTLKSAIRDRIESGMPVYAECGGLMYLSRGIISGKRFYPMVGIFPVDVEMCRKPQGHGYGVGLVVAENPFWLKGTWIKGHEFHYSRISRFHGSVSFSVKLKKGHGIIEQFDGMIYKNCAAFYTHVHAVGNDEWARRFVNIARWYRELESAVIGGKGVEIPRRADNLLAG
ncbi:cobyrinate a,c-diamide synthase [Thermodesulforhabdus norvegica]|uniref:Cobyrinate a,c-diamide synthase n=1 Tax=Thermodesulforhabdus norvegica TaxID=39841 RepID=Q9ACL1_9BACT|nr:cobyrinate a,c-diamide synthase [Thermodesulforhabdus norvegica]CAC36214.1 putative sirohaem a-amide synthetase [Thermodesulforhabdus norvegica]SFM60945.1 cobyrinic acid a,c-diamide synthase [Thermodesulforhabdus norvegica]